MLCSQSVCMLKYLWHSVNKDVIKLIITCMMMMSILVCEKFSIYSVRLLWKKFINVSSFITNIIVHLLVKKRKTHSVPWSVLALCRAPLLPKKLRTGLWLGEKILPPGMVSAWQTWCISGFYFRTSEKKSIHAMRATGKQEDQTCECKNKTQKTNWKRMQMEIKKAKRERKMKSNPLAHKTSFTTWSYH